MGWTSFYRLRVRIAVVFSVRSGVLLNDKPNYCDLIVVAGELECRRDIKLEKSKKYQNHVTLYYQIIPVSTCNFFSFRKLRF